MKANKKEKKKKKNEAVNVSWFRIYGQFVQRILNCFGCQVQTYVGTFFFVFSCLPTLHKAYKGKGILFKLNSL